MRAINLLPPEQRAGASRGAGDLKLNPLHAIVGGGARALLRLLDHPPAAEPALRDEGADDLRRRVPGAVVDEPGVEVGVGLRGERLEGRPDARRLVVHRHDHREGLDTRPAGATRPPNGAGSASTA